MSEILYKRFGQIFDEFVEIQALCSLLNGVIFLFSGRDGWYGSEGQLCRR